MLKATDDLSVGELAQRSGAATSALRFYEAKGLIAARRTSGNQRLYPRHTLRRLGFIRASQNLGLGLAEIERALATLPDGRTPTKADWQRLANQWGPLLDARIAQLQRLRAKLDSCIACGCLSMKTCALYNPQDQALVHGPGSAVLSAAVPPVR